MRCVKCAGRSKPEDRGWVIVLAAPTEPRLIYCPECLTSLIQDATGEDTPAPAPSAGADAQEG